MEQKLFTALQGEDAQKLNDKLSKQGFRRSQNVLYRPSCSDCAACLSARIRVDRFQPSSSQKRVLRRNRDLERDVVSPWATEEQFEMFQNYLNSRHAQGGMTDMDMFEFASMIEESPIMTRVLEYRSQNDKELIAACLTDIFDDGLSLVYSFFDQTEARRSLGVYMILDQIRLAQESGLPFVYLGYWVQGSPKMGYKSAFSGLEVYYEDDWQPMEDISAFSCALHPVSRDSISQQVANISLPDR